MTLGRTRAGHARGKGLNARRGLLAPAAEYRGLPVEHLVASFWLDETIIASAPASAATCSQPGLLVGERAEAGEVDWRPTETVPEDFYAL